MRRKYYNILIIAIAFVVTLFGIINYKNLDEKRLKTTKVFNNNLYKYNKDIYKPKNSKEFIQAVKAKDEDRAVSYYICNEKDEKIVYLTFDDGPSDNTSKILDILDKYDAKATFFVVGHEDQPSINTYNDIIRRGHAIGNHTYSHDYKYIYNSVENFSQDFDKMQCFIKEKCNYDMEIARFPGGSNNTVSNRYHNDIMIDLSKCLIDKNITYFDWNVDSGDANGTTMDVDYIIKRTLEGARKFDSPIILMHDAPTKKTTVYALSYIIEILKNEGYEFRALNCDEYVIQFLRAKY